RSLFSCLLVSSDTMSCTFEPHDNHFSQILVSIRRDTPDHTSFSVIDHALRVGDLVALWGLPDTPFAGTTSRLVWPENNGVVVRVFTAPVDKIDYFTPVQLLLFSFIG
ncbi:MAG: hypothetical protein K8I30_16570, partial [Anaerolineae bacterium]|nr:hypothetical protein [Anaerolineae bacterium]